MGLETPLRGILGARSATALAKAFEMQTVGDLLAHYPRRLDDRGSLTDFSELQIGDHVTVLAKTVSIQSFRYRPKTGGQATRTEVVVTDGKLELLLTFFRQPWKAGQLQEGTVAFFSGKVNLFRNRRQLLHPTCDVLPGTDLEAFAGEEVRRWWPIYPANAAVSSMQIMKAVDVALDVLEDVADPLPESVRRDNGLVDYRTALETIHRPADMRDWQTAQRRLRFDEAFVLQTVLAQRRHLMASLPAVPRQQHDNGLRARFDDALPFRLTEGQQSVAEEISADLARAHPMHRLLQGEVGSGKTVVALRAMLQVVDGGGQAALLAPTEVLAG
ncbi:MAG TPA: DEAD/DEAH box helicase, partial [Pseudonocardiaceae bacterium]|nr:DEAD/DEAH box helicase [Pseudonocardiaceae bacterium]